MQKLNFIDLSKQQKVISADLTSRIAKVLKDGQYLFGQEVEELEVKLAKRTGTKYCVSVGSGTDALIIALMSMDIGHGDEVIVPAFTFAATIEAVLLVGATPVLADIEPASCNICCLSIIEKISSKTKAIIPVSLYGQMAKLDDIMRLKSGYPNIQVLEDAAQSFGATRHGLKSCGASDIACTSFFPSKPLGAYGDGGAIFTNNSALARRCKRLRNHGQEGKYNHVELGLLSRLDTIQAAILLSKLEVFDDEVNTRLLLSKKYEKKCDSIGLAYVKTSAGNTNLRAQYTILTPAENDRDELVEFLSNSGIPTAIHYPKALHKYIPYKAYGNNDLINSESIANRVISLPFHPYISDGEVDMIFEAITNYVS